MSSTNTTIIMTFTLSTILIALSVTLGVIFNFLTLDSTRVKMGEVANHISLVMTELGTLCLTSGSNEIFMLRKIDLPSSVNIYGYTIELRNSTDRWVVCLYLDMLRFVQVESPLWAYSPEFRVETGSGTKITEFGIIDYNRMIYSGSSRMVVWAEKIGEKVTVGIGELRS